MTVDDNTKTLKTIQERRRVTKRPSLIRRFLSNKNTKNKMCVCNYYTCGTRATPGKVYLFD